MIINHNISAVFANRALKFNDLNVSKNIEKLSSGLRINRAGDDPAGLAVSEKMRSQVRGLRQAARNAEDAVSFIQLSEGYLQEQQDILQRLRELAIQAANGIYTAEDRMQIQVEVSSLLQEIDRVATSAQYNGMRILTGRFANPAGGGTPTASMWFHIGANQDQRVRAFIGTMTTQGLGIQGLSLSTPENANASIARIDSALAKISKQRADLGAYQSRFESTVKGLLVGYENMQAAESRIRDVDIAEEMIDYVKNQILTQSSTAVLAQANMKPASVLYLLR
jgi:flagellin